MTNAFAFVVLAAQMLIAHLLARIPSVFIVLGHTRHLLLVFAAMASMLHLVLTPLTIASVTNQRTPMNATRQHLIAHLTAQRFVFLAALHRLLGASASTLPSHHRMAGRTRSRMAQQSTRMLTAFLLGAQLTTTMGHIVPVVLRILRFAAETPIRIRNVQRHMLAGWATPTGFILGAVRPLDDAIQMNDVEAIDARPRRLKRFDALAAHKAFEATGVNLSDELLSLRTLAGVRFGDESGFQVAVGLEFGMLLFVEFFRIFVVVSRLVDTLRGGRLLQG